MPVSLRELRERAQEPVRDGSIAARALELLRSTPGEAWKAAEISATLNVEPNTLSPQLTRLRRRGLIETERSHWYALPDDQVAKRLAAYMTTRHANQKLGPENPKDWIDTPQR